MTISFDVSGEDAALIDEIANRAVRMAERNGITYPRIDVEMDLTACHANGCPLRLADLAKADEFNFAHDVLGIRKSLDRCSGKLTRGFLPRFALRKKD
jgi:hypothetical protein